MNNFHTMLIYMLVSGLIVGAQVALLIADIRRNRSYKAYVNEKTRRESEPAMRFFVSRELKDVVQNALEGDYLLIDKSHMGSHAEFPVVGYLRDDGQFMRPAVFESFVKLERGNKTNYASRFRPVIFKEPQ